MAKKAAEEVGSSFLMLESPFVKYSLEDASSSEIDGGNSFRVSAGQDCVLLYEHISIRYKFWFKFGICSSSPRIKL
ncbi:hypothetical protein CDL15_Pgr029227 [Punica granatum]|uniref:Uncharacterized protein n=1 Tax=Punica granatum TaxID=22663 RepID=A0A218XDT9_PUNGR|nr:hypothetical protein CDL15_Pgr029227 [Punica granatum]